MPIMGQCKECGITRIVSVMRHNQGLLCASCRTLTFRKNPENWKSCSSCGRVRFVASRYGGKFLCNSCYFKIRPCKVCSVIGVYKYGKCIKCFRKGTKPFSHKCSNCGLKFLSERVKSKHGLCINCLRIERIKTRPKESCFFCGKESIPAVRMSDSRICCGNCRKKFLAKQEVCPECGRTSYLYKGKSVNRKMCASCNVRARR